MSKSNFCTILMALVAMSCFSPSFSFAQVSKPQARKIQTPNTNQELKTEDIKAKPTSSTSNSAPFEDERPSRPTVAAERRLQQHGLGLGIGQTFLFGNYGKHGQDKITLDILYSYAASYSFDLLIDAHLSEHDDNSENIELMGLTGSIKGRVFEYDNLSPFFLAGLGFYAPEADRDGTGRTTQKLTFGLNFGGGVDLRLNEEFVIGVMAQMHWPFKVEQDRGSDLKGYYMKLLVTGMYLF